MDLTKLPQPLVAFSLCGTHINWQKLIISQYVLKFANRCNSHPHHSGCSRANILPVCLLFAFLKCSLCLHARLFNVIPAFQLVLSFQVIKKTHTHSHGVCYEVTVLKWTRAPALSFNEDCMCICVFACFACGRRRFK